MSDNHKFTGFQVDSAETHTVFHKRDFEPKPFDAHDVEIQVECCGVCSSDIHTLSGEWGKQPYPLAVGHEIVGKAIRVGPQVTLVKVGQRVGVGAQSYACLTCRQCRNNNEMYCMHHISTYGMMWPETNRSLQGGFSSHVRTHEHFVFLIPDAIPSASAAPLLCAGITTYSPLVRNGVGPGKRVGVVGLGGLGHLGLQWAKNLGAEAWAISRSHSKEADAKKMGADGFLATEDVNWNEAHKMMFDVILNTANNFGEGFDLQGYLSLLDVHGKFVSLGLPADSELKITADMLIYSGCHISASSLGSRKETLEMLQLAADNDIRPWVETVPINEENLSKVVRRMEKNDVKYRFTMVEYEKAFLS